MSKRKRNRKVILKLTQAQIIAIERQYWARYNNSKLNAMLVR